MYFFRVMFIASMLLVGLAHADELDDIEISFREQPRQLHSTVVSSLPESLQYPSLEQFQSSALEVGFAPDQLMDKLILLARLDLDAQVLVPGRLEQAQDIIEQLKIIARSDYEKAALYNLEGRYLGRVDQQYEQTVALNQQALEQLGDAQDKRSQLLRYVIYEDLGTVNLIANAEAALGKYYNINGQRTKSLQHYTEAFRLASRYNHPNQKALLQLNLAKLYRDMEQWDEALEYAHGAADAYKAMGSGSFLSHTMTVIAMVYGNTGEWNKAIDYYLNAQQIDAELKNFIAQGLNFHNLGEAYFHLNDYQVALDYLFQANEIFKDRKSNHYLVYNEMLIAEVGQAMEDWPLTMQHAIEALRLAKLLELPDEQIEALGYQTAAYKAQGKFQQALASQEESIQLQQAMLEKEQQTTSDVNSSAVTEQKLKLEVGQLRQDQLQRQEALHTRNILLAISLGLCLLLLALAMQQYRLRKQMAKKNQAQKAKMQLEPMSGLPGYRALLGSISSKTKGLALLSLEQEFNSDFTLGNSLAAPRLVQQAEEIAALTGAKVFLLRPGLFALTLAEDTGPAKLYHRLSAWQFQGQMLKPALGYIPLPLLGNPDIKLSVEVLFETAQLALAGAISLKNSQGSYVGFSTLDFTPAAIFSAPLYLQLQKSIIRGLIRVETNGEKDKICWPESQQQSRAEPVSII
ncbi:tetratricopeptide repeat protein [Shewanella algae]|uniref:tetratricopeptide repeat protein n=1 Tax=Shewanella algae TaxID=38313 RepID=UPI001AAC727D|nr:tetratricopeptide repeat protein [Shewanella algae]QTE89558.1 tetratricopeptide repeat protein [Shewanella algae]